MSAMVTEVYDALRSVGVDETKAKAAAVAMFDHELATRGDIARLEGKSDSQSKELALLRQEVQFLKWGVCAIILMLLAAFLEKFLS